MIARGTEDRFESVIRASARRARMRDKFMKSFGTGLAMIGKTGREFWTGGFILGFMVMAMPSQSWGQVGPAAAPPPSAAAPRPASPFPQDIDPDAPLIVDVAVEGNSVISTERIMSKIGSHPGRPYRRDAVREDVRRLFATHWFYDVSVEERSADNGLIIVYKVVERPVVGRVQFIGNKVLKEKDLIELTGLKAGSAMDPGLNKAMTARIEQKYLEKGYPFASVELLKGATRGDSDVVMRITEGPKTKIHAIDVTGNTFVSEARLKTMLSSKARFLFLGGRYDASKIQEDLAKLIEYYKDNGYLDVRISRRLDWTEEKDAVNVTFIVDEGPRYKVHDIRFAGNNIFEDESFTSDLKLLPGKPFNKGALKHDVQRIEDTYGQEGYIQTVVKPDLNYLDQPGEVDIVYQLREDLPKRVGRIRTTGNEVTKDRVIRQYTELAPGDTFDTVKLRRSEQNLRATRLFEVNPGQGIQPTVQIDPASDPADEFQDVIIDVKETQTGSLLFGVGVNSDSGVGGSFVVNERNFDLLRFPTSFGDLFSGRAFRGAGQELRLEAVPGSQVSRYSVTIREPKLFGLDYSLSSSGYYYKRLFQSWDEERAGGRFTLGKRFTRQIGASVTTRLEQIELSRPVFPTPADLQDALGDNFLASVRLGVDHDTRDSALNPGSGHLVELGYEQAFGDYTFPKLTLEGRQHWTLASRADGSGKQTLTARGEVGWTGDDTPIFERFYAGGFSSIRGFQFRGVSPTDQGIEVGGDFTMLSSLEYQFPLTADDTLGWVFFVDAGTVERQIEILDYRVSAGFGLRVQVPMLGPVPLAFDFAWPLAQKADDDKQVFSFFVGFFR